MSGIDYPEIYAFARAMNAELLKPENTDKGHWTDLDLDEIMLEVWYHAAKLQKGIKALQFADSVATAQNAQRDLRKAVLEFAADVGNCAMMVADCAGVLHHTEADLDSAESVIQWAASPNY